MSLYRFDNVIGQRTAVRFLQNAICTGQVPHALILCGEKGIGKMDLAMAYASALQCAEVSPAARSGTQESKEPDAIHGAFMQGKYDRTYRTDTPGEIPEGPTDGPVQRSMEPCGHCRSCKQIAAGSHPDVILVTNARAGAETKTNTIGVKTARFVQSDVSIKPYEGPFKIYIIPDAHNMNPQAQNALLKTLEEPPSYAVLLLLAQSTTNFLPTVLSRCITLRLYPATEEELVKDLLGNHSGSNAADDTGNAAAKPSLLQGQPECGISSERAILCARLSHGNPGRCRELAYREELWTFRGNFIQFIKSLPEAGSYDIVQYAEQLTRKEDSHTEDFLDFGLSWFRDILTAKGCGETDGTLIFADEITYINKVKEQYPYSVLEAILHAFDDAERRRAAKGNDTQIIEVLLLNIRRALSGVR